jgi:hypothetical protein
MARAAPTRAHDALGTVVTPRRVAMVAQLPTPTLAVRCDEIGDWRTGAKWCSCRATSWGRGLTRATVLCGGGGSGQLRWRPIAGEAHGGRWRWWSCPAAPWSQGGGKRHPKMEGHRVVVVLTGEKEDGSAWVRNRLRDSEIRHSRWPNGGGGFQGVSSECFGVGGSPWTKGEQRGKTWWWSKAYKASDG